MKGHGNFIFKSNLDDEEIREEDVSESVGEVPESSSTIGSKEPTSVNACVTVQGNRVETAASEEVVLSLIHI